MDNLMNMLTKKPIAKACPERSERVPVPVSITTAAPLKPIQPQPLKNVAVVAVTESETQICVKLPDNLVDYVRDFQHSEAVKTGNLRFSFKDALCSIIAAHKVNNPSIAARPDIIKTNEKKTGRKAT